MIDVSAVAAWGARGCLVWPDGEAHHMARHTVLPAAVLMAVLPRVPMRVPFGHLFGRTSARPGLRVPSL